MKIRTPMRAAAAIFAAATVAAATCATAVAQAGTVPHMTPTLVGSQPADAKYPFIAELQSRKDFPGAEFGHSCGGALISARWVVTAAHCVAFDGPVPLRDVQLRVGSNDRTTGGTLLTTDRIVIHPGFLTNQNGAYDIALVRLSQPVSYPTVRIGDAGPTGQSVRLLGWGLTCQGMTSCFDYPTQLRQLDTRLDDPASCAARAPISVNTELCVDNPGGSGDCYGDSGGPLLRQVNGTWWLAGLDSRGTVQVCGGAPSIYTRVSPYGEWIYYVTVRGRS